LRIFIESQAIFLSMSDLVIPAEAGIQTKITLRSVVSRSSVLTRRRRRRRSTIQINMAEARKGYINAGRELARRIIDRNAGPATLNSDQDSGSILIDQPFDSPKLREKLTSLYGIAHNQFALLLVRELAFINLHRTYGMKFKPLQSPLLGNVN